MRRSIIVTKSRVGRAAWHMLGKPGHTLPRFPLHYFNKHVPGHAENRKWLAAYLRQQRAAGHLRGREVIKDPRTWLPCEV